MKRVVVVAEHGDGRVRPVTYELLGCALEVQRIRPAIVEAVIVGDGIGTLAEEIAARSGCAVTALEVPGLAGYHGEAYKDILSEQLRRTEAELVLVAHTSRGAEYAPGLAVRLGASCISSVLRVSARDEALTFTRALFNGKVVAELAPETPLAVVTVAPGAFPPMDPAGRQGAAVVSRTVRYTPRASRLVGLEKGPVADSSLAAAEVIVAAGRGVRKQENLELAGRLAALFPRSALAGSRPLCDLGWLEYRQQVGMTGATVAPKVYIACGISGAAQHLAGMAGSGFVVAINSDPNAAIFNHADLCIVEDLASFLPLLFAEHGKRAAAETAAGTSPAATNPVAATSAPDPRGEKHRPSPVTPAAPASGPPGRPKRRASRRG